MLPDFEVEEIIKNLKKYKMTNTKMTTLSEVTNLLKDRGIPSNLI